MLTLGFVIIIFAGFVRAGSSTNSLSERRANLDLSAVVPAATHDQQSRAGGWKPRDEQTAWRATGARNLGSGQARGSRSFLNASLPERPSSGLGLRAPDGARSESDEVAYAKGGDASGPRQAPRPWRNGQGVTGGASCLTLEECQAAVRRLKPLAAKRLRIISKREHRIVALLHLLTKRGNGTRSTVRPSGSRATVRSIICQVFGSQCSKALSVAWCESRFNVYARNGQYLGLFQMGEYARARYGHGWDALTQTRAAYRYYLDAGWSPWSCA